MSGTADVIRALGVLCEPPGPEHVRLAAVLDLPGPPSAEDYVNVFLLQAYPYASVHLGAEGMLGGEARDRVAGFWRALGFVPPAEPDHLAALLGLYAMLIEAEDQALEPARAVLRRTSRQALLWEHLLSWCPVYLDKVAAIATPGYRAWAELLMRVLIDEARRVGAQDRLAQADGSGTGIRAFWPLPPPDDAADDWVAALLAPVRSGMIVTRADLARCARELDLGLRLGERAYILRALLEQDARATVTWLANEADAAALRHGSLPPDLGSVGRFWQARAETTAGRLRDSVAASVA
jgi:hypothetical protein